MIPICNGTSAWLQTSSWLSAKHAITCTGMAIERRRHADGAPNSSAMPKKVGTSSGEVASKKSSLICLHFILHLQDPESASQEVVAQQVQTGWYATMLKDAHHETSLAAHCVKVGSRELVYCLQPQI